MKYSARTKLIHHGHSESRQTKQSLDTSQQRKGHEFCLGFLDNTERVNLHTGL